MCSNKSFDFVVLCVGVVFAFMDGVALAIESEVGVTFDWGLLLVQIELVD